MPETILIVDDMSNHLRMTGYAIGHKLGYQVITACSGEEAIQWILSARQPQPDLVLLDLAMEIGGLEAIREIKYSRPLLPVVALVPYGDDENIARVVQAGVVDFLSKPVTLNRLRLSLCNALTIHRLKQTVARLEWRLSGSNEAMSRMRLPQDNGPADHFFDEHGRVKKLKSIEEEVIRMALEHNNGCMTRAAHQLGIGRSTLYRRMGEMRGIEKPSYISRANQATRPMMSVSSAEPS